MLQLPYQVPEEYDFEIEFTPNDAGANVNQYLSAAGHSFAWKLNAHSRTPPLYGLDLLDGKLCSQFDEAAVQTSTAIESGRRYRSTVEVRRDGLRALLDGKELLKWSGDFKRLSMEEIMRLRDNQHLGIGSWKRAVTFHKIEVREVTGRPSEVFAPGRTLQLMEGPTALVSGEGLATIRTPITTLRTVTVHDTDGLVIQFSPDSSGYIVHLPSRTEMVLEENTLDATILTLHRIR